MIEVNWVFLASVFGGGIALSALAVALSIRLAPGVGALDHPDSERKTQKFAVPRLGGVAVALAMTLVTAVLFVAFGETDNWIRSWSILIPALGIAIVGLVDDWKHLRPSTRLILQAATAIGAWALGTRITLTGVTWIDFGIFVLWVMVVVNGVNLLDNSDGLAGLTILIAASGSMAIALISGQQLVAILAASLAGVSIGFLWHNWAPARVYLGDSGAYFLGFLIAVLTVRLRPEALGLPWSALIPILLLLLPIMDTTFVVMRRVVRGIHPFTAGRDHLSHELQRVGLKTGTSVLVLQSVSLVGALGAFTLAIRG